MGAAESQFLESEIPTPTRRTVNFMLNGNQFKVNSAGENSKIGPKSVLVDFIRNQGELKGTKFMCREGGCGACVVMVSKNDPISGKQEVRAVNSCLTPVLSCDGCEITTIEGLGNKKIGYHDIQKRLTTFSGSQCGFCTPGMVMNMCSLKTAKKELTMKEIEDNFDGNICRCTGYRPILDAFKSMATDAPEQLKQKCVDIEDCLSKSCQIQPDVLHDAHEGPHERCRLRLKFKSGEQWFKPEDIEALFEAVQTFRSQGVMYRLVGGNTAFGVYKDDGPFVAYIDIQDIYELRRNIIAESGVVLGGATTLCEAITATRTASKLNGYEYMSGLADHLERVANVPVRNVATIAGNIMLKFEHREFPSDIFVLLETVGAKVDVASAPSLRGLHSPLELLQMDMTGKLIISVHFPQLQGYQFHSFKIAKRYQNAHASVNASFLFKLDSANHVLEKPTICYGGINPTFVHAAETETYFLGKSLSDPNVLQTALGILKGEVIPSSGPLEAPPAYRVLLAQSLLYKTILRILGSQVKSILKSGGENIAHLVTHGVQTFDIDEKEWPLNKPIPKLESPILCSGEAEYVNDMAVQPGELAAALVLTTVANADLQTIDTSEALKVPGVVKILQAKDIPGPNNYMLFNDEVEEILVKDKVKAAGQVACLVVANSKEIALMAAKKVVLKYGNIKKPILSIPDAILVAEEEGTSGIFTAKTPQIENIISGNITKKINGEFRIGGQYHFHMETQIALCVPKDEGMDVFASTQWVDHIQATIASALRIPNNSINVQVRRLGGAYGAKITRATHVAVLCALACDATNKPVRLVLDLNENMKAIGKRLPYHATYEVEFSETGKIANLNCNIICDTGVNSNEVTSSFAKSCFKSGYDSTGWNINAGHVNTNTVSNTYCRSPGSTQGIAIVETIMEHVAAYLKKDPLEVRMNNLLKPEILRSPAITHAVSDLAEILDENSHLLKMIDQVKVSGQYDDRKKQIFDFNEANRWKKRGMALLPMVYPIDYFSTDFPAFVTIYHEDGTVAVAHGGVEAGQGINTKVAQVVAHTLQIPLENVKVKATNNFVAPNAMSTGGSITSEFVCFAAMQACKILNDRMAPTKAKMPDATWQQLVDACYKKAIDLRAQYWPSERDQLMPYNVNGVNLTEVEIDVLTGEYKIVRVDVIEDAGKSMSQDIDIGQVEGATVMGLGLWTTEKLVYDEVTGQLLSANTWDYKVPLPKDIPEDFRVTLLQNAPNPFGILRSKAVGEPPLCMAVSVVFAMRNAIDSARRNAGNIDYYQIDGPISPEDIVRLCLSSPEHFVF